MGTDTICRGTFWEQNTKFRHQKKNSENFEMSGFARPTFCKRWQISLMLLIHDLGSNQNFGVLKRKMSPKKLKNKVGFK
jgi:hypothetical protein